MKNCLITKLKGVVDNSSLPTFGGLKFKVTNNINDGIVPFSVQGSGMFNAIIIGNGHFYKGTIDAQTNVTTEILNTNNTGGYRLSPGTYYVSITPKYGLTSININANEMKDYNIEMNIDDFKYNDSPIDILIVNYSGGNGTHKNVKGNLSSLKAGSRLEVTNSDVTGTMIDLAKLTHPNYSTTGTATFTPSKNITGSVEGFVENMDPVNYGKLIYLIPTRYLENHVTFHGNSSDSIRVELDASGNAVLTDYTGATTLATYTKATNTWVYTDN